MNICLLVELWCIFLFLQPLDTVVKIINDMQEKGINKDDLSAVAHLAFLENKPGKIYSFFCLPEKSLDFKTNFFVKQIICLYCSTTIYIANESHMNLLN